MMENPNSFSWDQEFLAFRSHPRPAQNLFLRNVELPHRREQNRHRHSPGQQYGKYKPFLYGRFVLGPYKWSFFATILAFLTVGLLMFYQHNAFSSCIGSTKAIIGFSLLPVTLFVFCWTSLTDPGVIPLYGDLDERWWRLPNYRKDVENGYRPRFCNKCSSDRPPRTYHCDVCRICIRRQDMHLYIGGTCIGERNFAQYFLLNIFQVLLGVYLVALNCILFVKFSESVNLKEFESMDIFVASGSICCGFIILMAPQTGLPMFAYRFHLLANDRSLREEYRFVTQVLRRSHSPTYIRKKNVIANTFLALRFWRKGSSWFRSNIFNNRSERYARLDTESPVDSYDDLSSFRAIVPVPPRNYRNFWNFSHEISSESPKKDLLISLQEAAKAKVNPNCHSVPHLDCAELFSLPGDRIRMSRDRRAIINLQRRLERFRELEQLPKSFIGFHLHRNISRSLSEGSIPRTAMTSDHVNEMMQEARAIQIQRMIQFVLNRDRRNIIRMAQRIDMGGILGIQHVENDDDPPPQIPNNLGGPARGFGFQRRRIQPIELERLPRVPQNLPAGIPQMVAAGLLPRLQGRLARHLSPRHMNILRSQYQQFDNELYQYWEEPYYVHGIAPPNPTQSEREGEGGQNLRGWARLRRNQARRPGRLPISPLARDHVRPGSQLLDDIPLYPLSNGLRSLEINNNQNILNDSGGRGRTRRIYFRGLARPIQIPDPDHINEQRR